MIRKSAAADSPTEPSVSEGTRDIASATQTPALSEPMAPSVPLLPDMLDVSTDVDDVIGFINLMKNCDHRFASKAHSLRQKLEAEQKKADNELADLDAQRARIMMRHDEAKTEILLAISRVEKNRAGIARALDALETDDARG